MTFSKKLREGGQFLRRQVAAALSDDQITMSGEILVTRPGMKSVEEDEVRATGVMAALAPLMKIFPGTKLTIEKSLLSVDIRFFCFETAADSSDMKDDLCQVLEEAVAMIDDAGFEARLNARGERKYMDRKVTFCCMNKGRIVSCRETSGEERDFFFKDIRQSASNAMENLRRE